MSKSKSVYVRVVHDLELLRYVLRCAIELQLKFPIGINQVYCYYCYVMMNNVQFFSVPILKAVYCYLLSQPAMTSSFACVMLNCNPIEPQMTVTDIAGLLLCSR